MNIKINSRQQEDEFIQAEKIMKVDSSMNNHVSQ